MFNKAELHVPVRWGIIGCGAVTEIKSGPAYQKTDGFHLAAVMRRTHDLARDYAERHNIDAYYSQAEEIIGNHGIDAVYIATPPDSHMRYALQVAEAGKPCCIEKPLAPCYQDSLAIHRAFQDDGIPLFVAYYRRSLPRFTKVRDILNSGEIGSVRHVSWQLIRPANSTDLSGDDNWRTDATVAFGGYFDDLASHGLDLFAYLFGEFKEVKGIGLNQQQLYSSLDSVSACWVHANGASGIGSWNFGGSSCRDQVDVFGSKGELSFSIFNDSPIVVRHSGTEQELFIENPEHVQLYHVQNMRDHLLHNAVHPSTGLTALHTSWVMDTILGRIPVGCFIASGKDGDPGLGDG